MPSRHLAAINEKLKAAYFLAYGQAEGDPLRLRCYHDAIDERVRRFKPWEELHEPAPRKPPAKRKPSLTRAIRQAEKAGGKVKQVSVGPDGTIVLKFAHNLDDKHSPTIRSDNEWDEVLQ